MKTRFQVVIFSTFLILVSNLRAEGLTSITFQTETYPPYNFTEGGKLQGIAVDLLLAASKAAKSPVSLDSITLLPWARAYRTTESTKNHALFSMTRTEQREEKFRWVGPIAPTRIVVLAPKEKAIKIQDSKQLNSYRFAVVRDDVGEQLLLSSGVIDKNLHKLAHLSSAIQMLKAGRVNLIAYEENVLKWTIKSGGFNPNDFEVIYVLSESDVYYAFNLDSDKAAMTLLQEGIDLVKKTPGSTGKTQYEEILSKY